MTKTALTNREIRKDKTLARDKILHEKSEGRLQRDLERDKAAIQADTNIKSAKIGALGRIAGGAMGAFGKLANDPSWYKQYVKDLEAFVRIPTFDRLGINKFDHLYSSALRREDYKGAIPGILTLHWVPTVGPQDDENTAYFRNAVNQSLARAKEKVLALNSRSNVNWEASDFGYNLFCSADLATEILELGRVIRVYQTYYSKNAYFAKSMIAALGWNFDDMVANFAEYRKQYILLATKFNSAVVAPKVITLYDRRMYLASNIFIDNDDTSNPRQVYAYVQAKAFKLADTEEYCQMFDVATYKTSITRFVAWVQLQMSAITDSPNFIEMYQDLRHAFRPTDLLLLPTTIEAESIQLNNVALNREQIHNTYMAPFSHNGYTPRLPTNNNGWHLCQDEAGYLYQGKKDGSAHDRKIEFKIPEYSILEGGIGEFYGKSASIMCNMHKSDISGDDIIDITRNMMTGIPSTISGTGEGTLEVSLCGTEIILYGQIHTIGVFDGDPDDDITRVFTSVVLGTANTACRVLNTTCLLSAFDWSPIVHTVTDNGEQAGEYATFMDAFTTFSIDYKSLKSIHEACVMGELYVGDIGFTH